MRLESIAGVKMAETTDGTVGASALSGALAGVKIVDLTRVLGGPFATQLLVDHGADVIKLEPPMSDEVRDWGPPFHDGDTFLSKVHRRSAARPRSPTRTSWLRPFGS